MTDPETIKERMEQGFLPDPDVTDPALRIANALEYVAFFLTRIDQKLAVIQEVLSKPSR